jgi:hypothetical protein
MVMTYSVRFFDIPYRVRYNYIKEYKLVETVEGYEELMSKYRFKRVMRDHLLYYEFESEKYYTWFLLRFS